MAFSIAFLEIRIVSKRCRSLEDASDNGSCFEEEVKSTGEHDGGRVVVTLDPTTSIMTMI